jgi:hypothetical protein
MKDIDIKGLWAFALLVAVLLTPAAGNGGAVSRGLVLDIYADESGKALVTGYAEGIEGLPFLSGSEYQYDEDALQLYAVTNALTTKNGDDWEIRLPTEGSYGEYHVTFYLSETVRISEITGTEGLDYLVSTSSDSFVVEFHGYDVMEPSAAVRYRQPLNDGRAEAATPALLSPRVSAEKLVPFFLFLILALVVIFGAVSFRMRGGFGSYHDPAGSSPLPPPAGGSAQLPTGESAQGPYQGSGAAEAGGDLLDGWREGADEGAFMVDTIPDPDLAPGPERSETSISGKMTAVMETLTERERWVMEALIKNGGEMTQAEIRRETGIPKSSLTGIVISLERRNIVTKKEWGRTNVIELSERLREAG